MEIFGVGDFWFLSAMCNLVGFGVKNYYYFTKKLLRAVLTDVPYWVRTMRAQFFKEAKKMIRRNHNLQFTVHSNLNHILLLRFCFAYDIAKHKIKTNSMPSISLSRTAPFAILGCILSAYALYVEHKVANKPEEEEFSAFCDIELIGASCR